MIDIGMPTLIELPEIDDCAGLCRELSLQFIELNMNLPQYQVNTIDLVKFKEIAAKHKIYYTIHLDENLNVSDFNPFVSEAYRHTVRETIKMARYLDIPVLNMHLSKGVYFTLPDRKIFLFDVYKEQYLQSICAFRNECEKAVDQNNMKICIENSNGYADFQRLALDRLLESPVFALTFDIGHNHGTGHVDESTLLNYRDKLHHFHFHDAAGRKDHLALGTGEIDLQKYFCLASQYGRRIVLETKTVAGLRQSVEWLKSRAFKV